MRRPHLRTVVIYVLLIIVFIVYTSLFYRPTFGEDTSNGTVKIPDPRSGRVPRKVSINPHNFHVIMSNTRICAKQKVKLLIMVSSTAGNFIRRKAIRETWGLTQDLKSLDVRLVFLLANPNDQPTQRQIVEEFRTHGDVIQEDFLESYMNLALKSVMGIKWALKHCSHAIDVMKTDDDIYVNVPLLVKHLQNHRTTDSFLGCIKQRKSFKPVKSANGIAPPPSHPPFVAGAGYVLSGTLLQRLYEASLNKKIVPVEDVYVSAHLAKAVGAHPPKHDSRFSCGEIVPNDCHMKKMFTGHRITPQRMYIIKQKLAAKSAHCTS